MVDSLKKANKKYQQRKLSGLWLNERIQKRPPKCLRINQVGRVIQSKPVIGGQESCRFHLSLIENPNLSFVFI